MKRKEIIKKIILEFKNWFNFKIIKRNIDIPINSRKIITLTGARRVGKTFTLFQTISELLKSGVNFEHIIYINFEDERLDLSKNDLDLILQAYRELYPTINLSNCYFFFDEIQNINGWDKFIRRIYDTCCKNIFITGSNSKFFSTEIATSLRGRTIQYEILPLSFKEFLKFKNFSFNLHTDFYDDYKLPQLKNLFKEFLKFGGFPEITFLKENLKIKTLQEYFEVMLWKDIVERENLKNPFIVKYFLKKLSENVGKFLSINKIYNELKSQNLKISKNTLYDYLQIAQNAHFIKLLKKHFQSILKTELAEKKVYLIDTGLLNSIRDYSDNYGILLENLIFIELIRNNKSITCFKEKIECDFVIDKKIPIQVAWTLDKPETLNRELKALITASKYFNSKEAIIITFDEENIIEKDNIRITIIPAWKFLLKPSL